MYDLIWVGNYLFPRIVVYLVIGMVLSVIIAIFVIATDSK